MEHVRENDTLFIKALLILSVKYGISVDKLTDLLNEVL